MDKIRHFGTIQSVTPWGVNVRILQQEACGGCAAKSICRSAEAKEKDISVVCDPLQYSVGQRVVIEAPLRVGLKAVWWAYVYPLLYLLATVFVAKLMGADDAQAAVLGLLSVGVALFTLYMRREKMREQFRFKIVQCQNQ